MLLLLLLTELAGALRLLLLTAMEAPTALAPAVPFGGRDGRPIGQREQPRLLGAGPVLAVVAGLADDLAAGALVLAAVIALALDLLEVALGLLEVGDALLGAADLGAGGVVLSLIHISSPRD